MCFEGTPCPRLTLYSDLILLWLFYDLYTSISLFNRVCLHDIINLLTWTILFRSHSIDQHVYICAYKYMAEISILTWKPTELATDIGTEAPKSRLRVKPISQTNVHFSIMEKWNFYILIKGLTTQNVSKGFLFSIIFPWQNSFRWKRFAEHLRLQRFLPL